ncbi:VOC family protein [Streptomyces sp. NPDC006184]|uniref:VOC family protein n=1 Tax=Streptomyces sp. NPDC006184 TaxID=3155455 RepID=UPI00339E9FC0
MPLTTRIPPSRGLPTARVVDHYAFTVPDLHEAVRFFTKVMGGTLCYEEGPIHDPHSDWMLRKLGVHPRSKAHIALVRLGDNCNLELFEYSAPGQVRTPPAAGDPGAHQLTWWIDDAAAARSHLAGHGITVDDPTPAPGEVRFCTSWGMPCTLRELTPGENPSVLPAPPAQDGLAPLGLAQASYTVADLRQAVAFFRDVLGGELLTTPGPSAALLRCGPTARIDLRQADRPGNPPPANSDIGGHHLAFYVDDVDEAARYLGAVEGVRLMGEPETVTEGPIAGDRWLYFQTPIGMQMEIINLPDGNLPYERLTTARRATPGSRTWNDRP